MGTATLIIIIIIIIIIADNKSLRQELTSPLTSIHFDLDLLPRVRMMGKSLV